MIINKHTNPLQYRMVEEAQLLAEEKWLIDALSKLKKQRNSLQIEKLVFESVKTKLRQGMNQSKAASNTDPQPATSLVPEQPVIRQELASNMTQNETDIDDLLNEITCNSQELNLAVTESVFGHFQNNEYDMVEEEHDEDDEDIMLDINLLMQASK